MIWPFRRREEPRLIDRLIRLAFGDIALVQTAIFRACKESGRKKAPLSLVVQYILENRVDEES